MTMLAKKPIDEGMRRPFGVAAKDVTVYMNGKFESDLEQEFSIPFYKLVYLKFSSHQSNLVVILNYITMPKILNIQRSNTIRNSRYKHCFTRNL